MSVSSIGSNSSLMVQSLIDTRARLDDLQRQLGTGKKSDTYAGLGLNRGLSVSLHAQLSALAGYDDTISQLNVRLSLAQAALGRMADIAHAAKSAAQTSKPDFGANGQTIDQAAAYGQLDELLGLLNTQVDGRSLFAGRALDRPATADTNVILNGQGAQAGLKQVISERNQADLGTDGLGRLKIPPAAGGTVSIAEDVAGSPFGFKLAGLSTTIAGATVSGPSGSPPAESVTLTSNPNAGDTVTMTFTLPDGSTENLTLTATTSPTPGPNAFTIGADANATAANLQGALTTAVAKLADTSLSAASTIAAANDFFDIDDANPPRRVAGPPFDSATALVAGTPANTVTWYTGDGATDSARSTASGRIDNAITVSYGMRANEPVLRAMVANVAVLAATTFSASDPNAADRYAAMTQRVAAGLDPASGSQSIESIEADLAGTQATVAAATDRHKQTSSTLGDLVQQVENTPPEEAAAKILALQTQLQASMQTTAMLYQMSLVNYLP